MSDRIRLKAAGFRNYLIPLSVLLLITISFGYLLTRSVNTYLLNQMAVESDRMVKHYTSRLSDAAVASNVINEMLDDKISVAGNALVSNHDIISNAFLHEFAIEFDIDEIYWYNPEGVVIFTNAPHYMGWEPYEGHPVYNFMKGTSNSLVEDIRQDTDSGIYYKYGYYKACNDEFVQMAILADKVKDITDRFSMQNAIDVLEDDLSVHKIYYIDNDSRIAASSDRAAIGSDFLNELNQPLGMEERFWYGSIRLNDMDVYKTLVPVYVDNEKIGTLAVYYSLENTKTLIRRVAIFGSLIQILLFLVSGFMVVAILIRNKRLAYLAYYDSLTQLPNKTYFNRFMKDELERNTEQKRALLMVNCRDFRLFNLTIGYQNSDYLLVALSNRLASLDLQGQHLFRLSADRFVIYRKNYSDQSQLISFCDSIIALFEAPIEFAGISKHISINIGIVAIDAKDNDVEMLIKEAEIAVSKIKDRNTIKYCFFNKIMMEDLLKEEAVENELREAIEGNSQALFLEYQPKIHLKIDKIIGFEALVRLRSKEFGVVPPTQFIGIAERKQLIIPLGEWVLKTTCTFIKTLEDQGYTGIAGSVNISPIQLLQEDFISVVINIVNETGIQPENLELEVTETVLMDDCEVINRRLNKLRKRGIKVSIDDFGTGYSSLARLRTLNIDIIKIDKYFINHLFLDNRNMTLVQAIISMAHQLGLTVIAEGVETEEQKEYLIENDCDMMQGYLFSKPVSDHNIMKLLT